MPTRFDAHCHFLNIQYLFRELLAMSWDAITGNYPYPKSMVPEKLKMELAVKGPEFDFLSFIKSLVSLMMNLTDSPQKVYENMKTAFQNNWNDGPFAAVPLMMDIYYAFDGGKIPPWELKTPKGAKTAEIMTGSLKEQFNTQADKMKEDIISLINEVNSKNKNAPAADGLDDAMGFLIREFNDEFLSGNKAVNKSIQGKTVLSWGFQKQLEEIEDMKRKSKDKDLIFPFLAVDPRRPGIMELVREKFGKGKERLFAGIKLYPPLGYLPAYPVLLELYDYCCSNNIPITFHCADGIIHTYCRDMTVYSKGSGPVQMHFDNEAAVNNFFAAPGNWQEIFETYRGLKVNFAHFGGYNEMKKINTAQWPESWTKKIIDMMEKNKEWNIYADISAYPQDDGPGFINQIWTDHPEIRERLLFGSDYIIELFLWKTIEDYYSQFKKKLNASLVNNSSIENVRAFLDIDEGHSI